MTVFVAILFFALASGPGREIPNFDRAVALDYKADITANASLEVVDIPMLQTIEHELVLAGDPQLTLLDASQLQRAASVRLELPKLSADVIERLRAVALP